MFKFLRGLSNKRTLRALLAHPKFKFRKLDTLANAIGGDTDYTKGLLYEIGARPSRRNDALWGLCTRVGYPKAGRSRASTARSYDSSYGDDE